MRPNLRLVAVALAASLVLGACASLDRPSVQPDEVDLPTPMGSFDASVAGTVAALESALAEVGERLEAPAGAYRPSEPSSLLRVPRVIRRADVADPDDGFIVIYEAQTPEAARERAAELADYVGSGFGQTNFVADTQFAVSILDDTVVFTTWSKRRSDDPDRAETVFDAVATVGTPLEIRK